jgi:hypothetical protein
VKEAKTFLTKIKAIFNQNLKINAMYEDNPIQAGNKDSMKIIQPSQKAK